MSLAGGEQCSVGCRREACCHPRDAGLLLWRTFGDSLFQEEREKRRLEQLERKKELQRLLEEEDSKLKGKSPKQATPGKVTRAQIEETIRKDQQQKENADTGWWEHGKALRAVGARGEGAWKGGAAGSFAVCAQHSCRGERKPLVSFRWRSRAAKRALNSSQGWGPVAELSLHFPQCFGKGCASPDDVTARV